MPDQPPTATSAIPRLLRRIPLRWQIVLALAAAGALLAAWLWPRPVFLSLSGTPAEMGRQQGSQCRWRIRLLQRIYLGDTVCGSPRAMKAKCAAAQALAPRTDPRYAEELEAMAGTAGVDAGGLWLGNSLVDVGACQAGCRAVVWDDGIGLPFLHGHNLDWNTMGGLARWSVAVYRRNPPDGRFRTVAIGVPGMVGALDVINEHGVALSLNQLGLGRGTVKEPSFILIRRIAETCATFEEARRELLDSSLEMPFAVTLSSAKEGRCALFEPSRSQGEIAEHPPVAGVLAAENACWAGRPWPPDSKTFRAAAAVAEHRPESMQALLGSPAVMMDINIYSVIFDWRHNCFYLAAGDIPAAREARYHQYPLFPK